MCQGPEVAGWKREWQNRVCVLVGGSGERVQGGRRGQVGCKGLVRGRVLGVVRVHRRGVWAWHVKGAGFVWGAGVCRLCVGARARRLGCGRVRTREATRF